LSSEYPAACGGDPLFRKYIQNRVGKILDLFKLIFPKLESKIEELIAIKKFEIEINFIPQKKDNGGFIVSPKQKIFNIWFGFSDKTDLDKSFGPLGFDYLYDRKSVIDLILAHEMIHVLQVLSEIGTRQNTFVEHSLREGFAVYYELYMIKYFRDNKINNLGSNINDFAQWRKQRLNLLHNKDKKYRDEYSEGTLKVGLIVKKLNISAKNLTLDSLRELYKEYLESSNQINLKL